MVTCGGPPLRPPCGWFIPTNVEWAVSVSGVFHRRCLVAAGSVPAAWASGAGNLPALSAERYVLFLSVNSSGCSAVR